jgi:hypothetical protein
VSGWRPPELPLVDPSRGDYRIHERQGPSWRLIDQAASKTHTLDNLFTQGFIHALLQDDKSTEVVLGYMACIKAANEMKDITKLILQSINFPGPRG